MRKTRIYNLLILAAVIAAVSMVSTGAMAIDLTSNLEAYWKLDGSTTDSSGNNHTLNLGMPGIDSTMPVWSTGGPSNSSLLFDGFDDYAFSDNVFAMGQGAVTLALAYKQNDFGTQYLLSNKDNFDESFVRLGTHNTGQVRIYIEDETDANCTAYSNAYDGWHHMIITRGDMTGLTPGERSEYGKIYVDGEFVNSFDWMNGDTGVAGQSWFLGNAGTLEGFFSGKMAEVRVYSRELDGDEAVALYESLPAIVQPVQTVDLTSNLEAHWKLDGTTADSSGNGHTLDLGTGDSVPTWSTEGPGDSSLRFDGVDDYAKSDNVFAMGQGAATIALAFKQETTGMRYFISNKDNFAQSFTRIGTYNEGHIRVYTEDETDSTSNAGGFTAGDEDWHHLVITRPDMTGLLGGDQLNGAKMYLDGELQRTFSWMTGDTGVADMDWFLGQAGNMEGFFDGYMSDVRVYSRELNGAEVTALYEGLPPISEDIAGDANKDGKVDGSDVTILAGNWQKGVSDGLVATWEEGDFNADGKVDGSDVTILAGNWQYGVTAATATVPEPSTLVLVLSAMIVGMILRRKK